MPKEETNDQGLLNLKAKHSDSWEDTAKALYDEAFHTRERRRQLETELAELKAKLPTEDGVVITDEENQLLQQLKQLGSLDEINEKLEAATKAIEERDSLQRRENVRELLPRDFYAEAVLDLLPKEATLVKEGDAVVVQEGDTKTPLDEWADAVQADKHYITLRAADEDGSTKFVRQSRKKDDNPQELKKLAKQHANKRFGGKPNAGNQV